jgi:hypothetical protein
MRRLALPLAALCLVAADAAPAWDVLRAPEAQATSYLKSNWNKYTENYHPSYALDENPATAWVEGVDGLGGGETLTIPVSTISSARALQLRIRNGYQKSDTLLAANAAPKDVKITVRSSTGAVVALKEATLEKKMGWQEVVVDLAGRGVSSVEITLVTMHPGKTYQDTCISDVVVSVDSDVPYKAEAEAAKHAALKAWIAGRVETAKYFAAQPKDTPWAHGQYPHADQGTVDDVAAMGKSFATYRDQLDSMRSVTTYYRGDPVGKKAPLPDGLEYLEPFAKLVRAADVSFFQATDGKLAKLPRPPEAADAEYWPYTEYRTPYRVQWRNGPGSTPSVIAWDRRQVVEERGTSTSDYAYVGVYDEQGRLTAVFEREDTMDEMGNPSRSEVLTTLHWNAEGKVTGLTRETLSGYTDWETGQAVVSGWRVRVGA